MRGKRALTMSCSDFVRITPAHAGKTYLKFQFAAFLLDHPRACGENLVGEIVGTVQDGSPPRMRGKLANVDNSTGNWRITPAHAGKTQNTATNKRLNPDHPRACGENKLFALSPH